jgi:hypothetical protein
MVRQLAAVLKGKNGCFYETFTAHPSIAECDSRKYGVRGNHMRAKRTRTVISAPEAAGERAIPFPEPAPRCRCGQCRDCIENERWDRIFARFRVDQYWEDRGLLQSPLRGL